MRWWLAAVFVAIATLTAALIGGRLVEAGRSGATGERREHRARRRDLGAIRRRAGDHRRQPDQAAAVDRGAAQRRAVRVLARSSLIAQGHYDNIHLGRRPAGPPSGAERARRAALVSDFDGGRSTLVALPLERRNDAAVFVAYAPKPPYGPSLAIFRHDVVPASIYAVAIAALTGLIAATLIARRLKRIARSAAAIEQGDFARELEQPGLHDEIGDLAVSDRPHARAARRRVRAGERRARPAGARAGADERGRARGRPRPPRRVREREREAPARRPDAREGHAAARDLRRPAAAPARRGALRAACDGGRGAQPARGRRDHRARGRARVVVRPRRARLLRHHRAGAAAPGRARVRHQRLARAADAGHRHHQRGRGAAVGREGRRRARASASSS